MSDVTVEIPHGLVAVTTYGQVRHETVQVLLDSQRIGFQHGLTNTQITLVPGGLVAKARNDAILQMLQHKEAQWIVFLDGDMTVPADWLLRLVITAYHTHPQYDIVGGYCNLRQAPHLPTMDTGTGTWEIQYPQQGVVEVMRTGGACLLIKRPVVERMPFPWFGTRVPARGAVALYEVDNMARQHFHGTNPFQGPAWEALLEKSRTDPQTGDWQLAHVGEDSAFCDRARAHGFRIAVNTDLVTGHVETQEISWVTLRAKLDEAERDQNYWYGILAA